MTFFNLFAMLITTAALFGFLNQKFLKLPATIGMTVVGLLFSLALLALEGLGFNLVPLAESILKGIDFDNLLLQGMLSFLLFAGALNLNTTALMQQRTPVLILAVAGTLLSTFLVAGCIYGITSALGIALPFAVALVFGALISPTDPIAVLDLLKRARVPVRLESLIAGESLFNDGVGVVVFIVVSSVAFGMAGHGEATLGLWDAVLLFAREALGGAIYGGILGYAAHILMRSIDDYATEIMLTLAVVTGGYALAQYLHVSGPIAMVVAGLMVGQQTRQYAMSATTRHHLDAFWETIDHILNAILFVLIGLEAIVLKFPPQAILMAALAIPIVLLSRWLSVVLPIQIMHSRYHFIPYTVRMLTWGGLRGGISIALALSLPAFEQRDLILAMTYGVVIFSILVQGLTVGPLAEKIARVENKN